MPGNIQTPYCNVGCFPFLFLPTITFSDQFRPDGKLDFIHFDGKEIVSIPNAIQLYKFNQPAKYAVEVSADVVKQFKIEKGMRFQLKRNAS